MAEFAAVINVASLDGNNGFRLDGDAVGDYSGRVTAGGGDVNGDGLADLLIGAPSSLTGGIQRGLTWVVFGAAANPASQGLAARVAAGSAYRFQGELTGDQAGYSIANAGDVNGDGFDDIVIGAAKADPDSAAGDRGASYLVFGGALALENFDLIDTVDDNQIELANIGNIVGYRFDGGADKDYSGLSVSGAGDVNGDGIDDLIIGAPFADPDGGTKNGASYIVFGGAANLGDLDDDDGLADGLIDLAQISAGQGLRLDGATAFTDDQSGRSVALVGDVNGDGFGDALVGARYADPNGANNSEGTAYLVFGKTQAQFAVDDGDLIVDGTLDLASLTGFAGTRFDGVTANDQAGRAVSGLGDVNGDGFADMVIGAPYADPSGDSSGSAYVVFGKSAFGASSDLSALNGVNGFRLDGLRVFDLTGLSVSAAGDVNGDGFDDILTGASGFDRPGAPNAGAAFVVFGKSSGFASVIDLGALDGDDGFRIEGAAGGDRLSRGAAGAAGDVNGDGFDDIVVGADGAENNGIDSGSTYVIYGHRAETAVTRAGTALDNRINGGKGADAISGNSGNDTLLGWEDDDTIDGGDGNDVVTGGNGDDTIAGKGGTDSLSGGDGNDTISGGSERDTIIASAGEDHIDGGSERDLWDFTGFGAALPIVLNLSAGTFTHPNEEDIQTFASIEDVTGTGGADTITGNHARNILKGGLGADTLDGGGAADSITGGNGRDILTGGARGDRFLYGVINDSAPSATARDHITDFTVDPAAGTAFVDRIDVFNIDAMAGAGGNQAFTFIGAAAFTAEGQIRAVQSGANTLVELNTSGVATADMRIELDNFTAANLSDADFVL